MERAGGAGVSPLCLHRGVKERGRGAEGSHRCCKWCWALVPGAGRWCMVHGAACWCMVLGTTAWCWALGHVASAYCWVLVHGAGPWGMLLVHSAGCWCMVLGTGAWHYCTVLGADAQCWALVHGAGCWCTVLVAALPLPKLSRAPGGRSRILLVRGEALGEGPRGEPGRSDGAAPPKA